MSADTKTTPSEKELGALRSVERAARAVVRFPDDRRPKEALFRALRRLDQARMEQAREASDE